MVRGASRCAAHKRRKWSTDRRPSARQRGYDTRWDKVRARYAGKNPLCEPCAAAGYTVPGDVVDHIIPWQDGGEKYSLENLQMLCHTHHNKKTARERSRG